jgi:hypothetical protein
MNSDKRSETSAENGKKGGRPPGLVLVVVASGERWGETKRGGLPCRLSKLVVRHLGAGWWMVESPEEVGRVWVVDGGRVELVPGRYTGKHVPKGSTPRQVVAGCQRGGKRSGVDLPEFRAVPSPVGIAYFQAEHWRGGNIPATVKAAREDWEKRGRREWERLGWSIQREKGKTDTGEAYEIAGVVEMECGESWGEVAKSWVRRGRVFPHPWGAALEAWVGERKRREVGGFEV